MSSLGDYRAAIAGRLTPGAPAGVTVTTDPAMNPPAILVDLVTLTGSAGIGAFVGTVPVKCIVPPPGDAVGVELLETMVDHVLGVMGPGFDAVEPGLYRPTADVSPPMVSLTYPATVPNPHC